MYRHHLKRNNLLREYERRIKELEAAINTALDAVAAYPDHPMTAAEVVLRDALNDLAIPRYVEGE